MAFITAYRARHSKNSIGNDSASAFVTTALAVLWLAGCGGTSANQALDKQLKEADTKRLVTARFSGKVTIDGEPPVVDARHALVVMLYDPQSPPDPRHPPLFARCQHNGSFEFGTYSRDDGVPSGSYIVLFAEPESHRGRLLPPDDLKNLYNDPDKNGEDPQFHVEIKPPGKIDWTFNLEIAGKEAVANPGVHAVTKIVRH